MNAVARSGKPGFPRDMGYAWNGISYQQSVAGGGAGVFALSLVFVFLILAALYESWSLPFSVLLSVPVAVCGAFFGLWSRHLDNDVYAQIGLIMLIGLSAKNAILIVEFAKAELREGRVDSLAALKGARVRLRPILMTSFAFIFGLFPLWMRLVPGESPPADRDGDDNRHDLLNRLRDLPGSGAVCRGRMDLSLDSRQQA